MLRCQAEGKETKEGGLTHLYQFKETGTWHSLTHCTELSQFASPLHAPPSQVSTLHQGACKAVRVLKTINRHAGGKL